MICISVTPTSRKLAKVDLLNASRHCDLVELCLDHLVKEPDIGEMISGFDKPILVSCRREQDGGQFKGTEEQRIGLLRQAIVAGPAYIELELDIAAEIPRFGETKRVVSCTRLDRPLGNIDSIFEEATKAKADVVKFTWPTPNLDAAWPLLVAVTKKRDLPVVGMGLGWAGLTFSLLGRKYGSPWIYAALEKGMEAHQGQATIWELDEVYDWKEIGKHTRLIGFVGFGNEAATGIKIFNAGFKALGLNTRCLPLQVSSFDKLKQQLEVLKINALAISPRLGSQILEFAEDVEEAAKGSGYADLLLKQPEGWTAYNMIWRNALRAMEDALGKKDADDRPLDRRNVLLVGANGTAQALAHGICRRKGVLSITAPKDDCAQEIAKRFDVRHVPFGTLYDTLADVVVITDPEVVIGHKKSEMNPSYLRPNMTVLDICKMPEDTLFLQEARQRGCRVIEPQQVYNGMVASQFKSFTGKELPPEVIGQVLAGEE